MSSGGQISPGFQALLQQAGYMPQASAASMPMNQPTPQAPSSFLNGGGGGFTIPYQLPQFQPSASPYSAAFQGGGITPRIGPQSNVPMWQPSSAPMPQQSGGASNFIASLGQAAQMQAQPAPQPAPQPTPPPDTNTMYGNQGQGG